MRLASDCLEAAVSTFSSTDAIVNIQINQASRSCIAEAIQG